MCDIGCYSRKAGEHFYYSAFTSILRVHTPGLAG